MKSLILLAALSVVLASPSGLLSESIITTTTPQSPRTYIIPGQEGSALQLGDDVFRFPVTKNSSNGELVFLVTNGQSNTQVTPHYHSTFYETFYCVKGRVRLWAKDQQRILTPGDFGAVPHGTIHTYQFIEPDTLMVGAIQPGGFEDFFFNVSSPYTPAVNAPFPPDQPLPFPIEQFVKVALDHDVHVQPTAPLNYDIVNGTTSGAVWHTGNNTLPPDSLTPYYLANNWGPKYLVNTANDGKVVVPLVSTVTSAGNWTMGTIAMRKSSTMREILSYPTGQTFFVLEGTIQVRVQGATYTLQQFDTIYIQRNTSFSYWNERNWAKLLTLSAGSKGHLVDLLDQAKEWDYAVPPTYV